MSLTRDQLVIDILRDRAAGKSREEIFEDLVDQKGMSAVYVRSVLESLRW